MNGELKFAQEHYYMYIAEWVENILLEPIPHTLKL